MPLINITVSCPVHASFRTAQVAGMFDVPLDEKLCQKFSVELPGQDEPWQIGLIVGPSGSGKSTIAQAAYGDGVWRGRKWPADRAVVDGFGDLPTKQIVRALTAVGFSSPPSWVKPYGVLSSGEQFRCELARALMLGDRSQETVDRRVRLLKDSHLKAAANAPRLVVFDEFTSVVDRNVAKICSAAVAKAIRRGHLNVRFVAVTCHYDVAEWLAADWVLDMATGQVSRRRLRRPPIDVAIHRCDVAAWRLFANHHYLTATIAPQARCYIAMWRGEPVAFAATLAMIGRKRHRRFTRIVTLPDYQGVGIGMATVEAIAAIHREDGFRINVTSSHPALIAHCRHSPGWRCVGVKKRGSTAALRFRNGYKGSLGRAVVSFEYEGE